MIIKKVIVIFITMLLISSSIDVYAQEENSTMAIVLSIYEGKNPEKAASDYFMRGKEVLITTKNVELAAKYFIKALANDPKNGAVNYELAKFFQPEKALSYSMIAYASDTTNYWYCEQLAEIFATLNFFDKAIPLCEKMIKLRPDSEDGYKKLSTFYYYTGKIDIAMSLIDTINMRFGSSPEIALLHSNMIKNLRNPTPQMIEKIEEYVGIYNSIPHFTIVLGDVYLNIGDDKKAIESYKQASVIDPEELRGDIIIFDYYYKRQEQGEAVKYISSLFMSKEIDVKEKISIYNNLIDGNIFLYRNFPDDVNKATLTLLLAHNQDMEVRKIFSIHLLRKGDIASALAFNKTGLDSGIYDYDSFKMIVEIEAYNKNFDSAMVYLDKGYALFPDKVRDINRDKASIYSILNQNTKAIALIKSEIKEIKEDSIRSFYYGLLGDVYYADKNNKMSYKAYDKALKYNPKNIHVLNNYSYHLSLEDKDLERALKMSKIVLDREPSNPTFIDTYAWILFKLKRYSEARELMAKAVALDSTRSSEIVLHYGDILDALGNRLLAESYWKKALEYGGDESEINKRLNKTVTKE